MSRTFPPTPQHEPSKLAIVDREAEWFAQARNGDRAAFGRLVSAVQDRLYNAVFRMVRTPEEAMDVTQETFASALDHLADFRGDAKPYTWLFRIAMNCAISRQRKASVRAAAPLDGEAMLRSPPTSRGPGPTESAIRNERVELVRRALATLAAEERAILVMRDVDGMEYTEMASALEVPLGTLKSRLFRARLALRAAIERLERNA